MLRMRKLKQRTEREGERKEGVGGERELNVINF